MTDYYVRPVNGDDSNDGLSFETAFGTMQKAADTAQAGDTVFLCAEAPEVIGATVDLDTHSGTSSDYIRFIGCDASGAPLESGHYVIDGSELPPGSHGISVLNTVSRLAFERIRVTGCPHSGVNLSQGTSWAVSAKFKNCRFDHNAGSGIGGPHARVASQVLLVSCEADHNGGIGAGVSNNNNTGGGWYLINCALHHNGTMGYRGHRAEIIGCLIYRNVRHGVEYRFGSGNVVNSVVYGNGEDGVLTIDAFTGVLSCAVAGNGGYGVRSVEPGTEIVIQCLLWDNTSGDTPLGTLDGDGNVHADPKFVSVVDGEEDFHPAVDSPLRRVLPDRRYIGALPYLITRRLWAG